MHKNREGGREEEMEWRGGEGGEGGEGVKLSRRYFLKKVRKLNVPIVIGHAISRMGHIFRILKLHNAISRLHIFLNYTENIFTYYLVTFVI